MANQESFLTGSKSGLKCNWFKGNKSTLLWEGMEPATQQRRRSGSVNAPNTSLDMLTSGLHVKGGTR